MVERLDRRRFLATVGAASAALVPGCGSGDTATETGQPGPDPTAERTATAGAGETAGRPTATAATDLVVEAPATHPQDRPAEIRLTGADPGAEVSLTASTPSYGGQTWTSEATFEADEDGVVDLAEATPVSGTYESADPMGWLWSMRPSAGSQPFYYSGDARQAVTLRATDADGTVETEVDLRLYDPDITVEAVETDELVGYCYEPAGEGPHPGVLALHGSGGNPIQRRSALLATRGYAALSVKYFGEGEPIPDTHDSVPLEYFERAQSWLRAREGVRDVPVGVLGVSRGGELALLLGARFDWVGAVVSYVGSAVVWEGGSADPPNVPWTHGGDPVAHLTWDSGFRTSDEGHYRFRPAADERLDSVAESELEAATIAVEEAAAPVLMLSGTDDQVWPSVRLLAVGAERLREADFDHAFEHRSYDGAGHGVTAPYLPTAGRRVISGQLFGGAPAADARANADSWPAVLDYLDRGLRAD
ncbi:acyl-CoA thioesterase/BAAT N-terminal domain-containing protein [Halosimplex litoreum]|uniref:Acyl-CoA thioesterase/BAAT N-terminal domain-containing protein n=1 Tax=Halosimplex litoreum TaxID=1198301 RepID=A0A7U3WAX3_9EURY|nr:acyl-CoA thioesterase/bile acid-CoA:amino acid N-acyltransferase family protein [Halosimplex litoreum]QPV64768.1 acyl-CoA thioesterase/BAAT N-terminal domain-containing protein [Halosimplex litoreum]